MRRFAILFLLAAGVLTQAQTIDSHQYSMLQWRCIGPFRGGRTVGACGVAGQPNVFYIGVNNGGVWKTNDAGRTWNPVFDDQPTGSIGALAVSESDPNTIYVGSGEGLQRPDLSTGDGMYKSTDGGKTWAHLGLRDGLQISSIIIDPKDANRLFVAVLGHPYGANEERGIYRSTDGGQSFQKVLYKDIDTGAVALAFDPSNSQTVYGVLWAARQGPWENGQWQGPGSGLFKSTDGGTTWNQVTKGLPTFKEGLGRIGVAVAPSDPQRLYALVDADQEHGGVYRSDDAGANWTKVNGQDRLWGRGSDFAELKVDPKNRDIVYDANTESYRSTDGGKTFVGWKGAPGGDDYHTFWINPNDTNIILLAGDQGAAVTVNGGETWSSWYNQPTAQFYHVSTDNQFPYWVYGGQQESGSAGVASRGNDGAITMRDWHPVGAEEYGYVAPDPLNANIIYGGKVQKWDRITGQVQNVSPAVERGRYRFLRTAPLLFSPVDPHVLYLGGNVLFKTSNGGHSWDIISPDLTREHADVPAAIGVYRTPQLASMRRRGVIYAVGPSYKDTNVIWAGTDDGLIHLTRDGGKTWSNVTPPDLTAWSKVSQLDAGHSDNDTVYAAINRIRLDDQHPYIYRTHDGGKTWLKIVSGLPDNGSVNTVREDPQRKGLLYCGTETAVFFSLDDGDNWQPLRQNMPATSIRDLVIHGDDLVVGTHGRSFWILDDVTPLRQFTGAESVLYKPGEAYRLRRDTYTDTPMPPDEPVGKNPPDGAIIDFYLKSAPESPVVLEIVDSKGELVRRFATDDKVNPIPEDDLQVPMYWVRQPKVLSATPGAHRWIWDLRYPLEGPKFGFPIAAIVHDTPAQPEGPLVLPGAYTLKLTVDGRTYSQILTVKLDPRITTPLDAILRQHDIAIRCYYGAAAAQAALDGVSTLRKRLPEMRRQNGGTATADTLEKALNGLENGSGPESPGLGRIVQGLEQLMAEVQEADQPPTQAMIDEDAQLQRQLSQALRAWDAIKK